MGSKYKYKTKYEHLPSQLDIRYIGCCSKCPLKLYIKDDTCIQFGLGNINADIVFLTNMYDINKCDVWLDKFVDIWKKLTCNNLLDDVYISRLVKCYHHDYKSNDTVYQNCFMHSMYEIIKIKPRKIIAFSIDDKYLIVLKGMLPNVELYKTYDVHAAYYNKTNLDKFKETFRTALYDNI